MMTLDLSGASPTASNLHMIASGIRNVFGLQFDSNGDLWFSDNGMDALGPGQDPVQADELNRILAAQLTPGSSAVNFGFPTCFPAYGTGVHAVDNCTHPEAAFIPQTGPDGLMYSQGAAQIALAPSNFPAPFNGGIFVGFSGASGNTRNPVIYYDPTTGQYQYFVMGGSMGNPLGLLATSNALYISDWGTGEIYQLTSLTPEPSGLGMGVLGLLGLGYLQHRVSKEQRS